MKNKIQLLPILLLSAFALFFVACSYDNIELPEDQTEEVKILQSDVQSDLFRTINSGSGSGPIGWTCQGSCSGVACKQVQQSNGNIQCGPCQDCHILILYDNASFLPGDDGYDDLYNIIFEHYHFTNEFTDHLAQEFGLTLDQITLTNNVITVIEDSDEYGVRYEFTLDDGQAASVLFKKGGDSGDTIVKVDCTGECPCLEEMQPNGLIVCSCDGCLMGAYPLN